MTKPKPAKRRPRSAALKAKGGRPTIYRPEFAEQARRLCEYGATDADIASFFNVGVSTIYVWKLRHPEFLESTKRGKDVADEAVERSLFLRATGYSHDAVKILQHEGEPVIVPFVQHHPPDVAASIFWLKNRRPQRWRDRPVGDGEDDDLARARRIKAALAEIEGVIDQPGE